MAPLHWFSRASWVIRKLRINLISTTKSKICIYHGPSFRSIKNRLDRPIGPFVDSSRAHFDDPNRRILVFVENINHIENQVNQISFDKISEHI